MLRRLPLLVLVAWLPLVLLTLAEWAITRRPEPLVRDLSIHARLLLSLPLVFAAERALARLADITAARLLEEGFLPPEAEAPIHALLFRTAAFRQALWPQAILVGLALGSGVAALTGLVSPAGMVGGLAGSRLGLVRLWYALVSLPLFQFFLWRSILRWGLWVRVLGRLARVPLVLRAGHPDRHGGIRFLRDAPVVFAALMLLALSCVLCGGWATQVRVYGADLAAFKSIFALFVIVGVLMAVAPLVLFVPQLVRARVHGVIRWDALATDYTHRFETRWLDGDRAELLGTPDLQSFADLGNCYRENVEGMRVFLFGLRDGIALILAALLPALPVLCLKFPASEILKKLLHLAMSGLPG